MQGLSASDMPALFKAGHAHRLRTQSKKHTCSRRLLPAHTSVTGSVKVGSALMSSDTVKLWGLSTRPPTEKLCSQPSLGTAP